MNNSYIKLYRELLTWEWYNDSKMVHLFIHLVLSANHAKGQWRGFEIERGQLITGIHSLKKSTGISTRSVRTCLNRLKTTNEITIKTTNKFSLITILKYEEYQSFDKKTTSKTTSKITNERQSNDNQTTTNNNNNNNNNDNIHPLQVLIKEKLKNVSLLENQLTLDQCEKLTSKYKLQLVHDTLASMENKKDLCKKYTSVYFTLLNWIKIRVDNTPVAINFMNTNI